MYPVTAAAHLKWPIANSALWRLDVLVPSPADGKQDGKKQGGQDKGKGQQQAQGMSLQNVLEDLNVRFIINCPEEELTLERVFFQIEQAFWFYDDFYRKQFKYLPHLRMDSFSQTFVQRCPTLKRVLKLPNDNAVCAALANFSKLKNKIPTCGAVLLSSDMNQCVLVKGWIGGSAWGFPKGKMDEGESEVACAIRECAEETGFDASAHVSPEDFVEITHKGQNQRLYMARDVPADYNFVTQTRNEISAIKWFDVGDLAQGKVGGSDRFSNSASRFMPTLVQWIEKNRPAGSAKPGKEKKSKKSKKKKDKATDKGSPNMEGSADEKTFGSGSDDGWSLDDMFQVNEEKFGVVNSFTMDEYTVPLPDAATQAKAMEEYYAKNGGSSTKGGKGKRRKSNDKMSPTLQSQQGQPAEQGMALAPSVANIFAMAAGGGPPVPTPKPEATPDNYATTSCGARAAPAFSFSFNKEEILECI